MKKLFFAPVKPYRLEIFTIFFLIILTHGLMFFNRGVFWDGWFYYNLLTSNDWSALYSHQVSIGLPLVAYLHWGINLFPDLIFGYRIVAFICILIAALSVFFLANYSGRLSRFECLLVTIIFILFPANRTLGEISTIHYVFCYSIFLVACSLSLLIDGKREWLTQKTGAYLALRTFTLVMFFYSFNANSLLPFYFGFFPLWLLVFRKNISILDSKVTPKITLNGIDFFRNRMDYLAVPFIFCSFHSLLYMARLR